MILVIDNYDSFTFNLVQYLQEQSAVVRVERNDVLTVDEVALMGPEGVVLSPGPGTPECAGICVDVVRRLAPPSEGTQGLPILGVCLGHQAIAYAYGATIGPASRLMHGRTSQILHGGQGVFESLPSPFIATRYHSLTVVAESIPDSLEVTAKTAEGEIMGLRHRDHPVEGVQFHPESFLTEHGHHLLANFLDRLEFRGARA